MDTAHLLRAAGIACVGLALGLSALALRHHAPLDPGGPPQGAANPGPGDESLHAQLLACSALGEAASSDPDCRAAWAAKRRHFLGLDRGGAPAGIPAPVPVPTET